LDDDAAPVLFQSCRCCFLSTWRNGGTSNLFFFLLGVVVASTLLEVAWYFLLEVAFNSGLAGKAGLVLLLTRDLLELVLPVLAGEAVRGLVLDKCKSFFFKVG
jgi:hypothetical protein